jgi:hypothetical protein
VANPDPAAARPGNPRRWSSAVPSSPFAVTDGDLRRERRRVYGLWVESLEPSGFGGSTLIWRRPAHGRPLAPGTRSVSGPSHQMGPDGRWLCSAPHARRGTPHQHRHVLSDTISTARPSRRRPEQSPPAGLLPDATDRESILTLDFEVPPRARRGRRRKRGQRRSKSHQKRGVARLRGGYGLSKPKGGSGEAVLDPGSRRRVRGRDGRL